MAKAQRWGFTVIRKSKNRYTGMYIATYVKCKQVMAEVLSRVIPIIYWVPL